MWVTIALLVIMSLWPTMHPRSCGGQGLRELWRLRGRAAISQDRRPRIAAMSGMVTKDVPTPAI